MPLDVVLHDRQQRGEHEVPHRGHHQQRPHRSVAVVDHPHLVEQLADRHHVDDRRALEQVDDLVRPGRQDRAHRLGQHDPPELTEPWDPERRGRLALTEVHRQQPRTHHLGRVRRLVHGEPDDRRGHRAEQVERLARPEARPERDPDRQRRVEVGEVVPEQQVDDQGDRPEQPRVGPAHRLQQRALRQPHGGEHGAEAEAEHRAPQRQPQRRPQRLQDRRGGEVLEEDRPVPLWVRHETVDEHRQQHGDDDASPPSATGAADGRRGRAPGHSARRSRPRPRSVPGGCRGGEGVVAAVGAATGRGPREARCVGGHGGAP